MKPSYLSGHLAPVADEITALDLPVTGTLPPELTGRYFRNGPNPRPGVDPGHWFAGDGMIHGIRLTNGRAEWYRNRWVKTTRFTDDAVFVSKQGVVDLAANPANTSVIRHADKIYALVESGLPYEVSGELDTLGARDFGGKLTTAMTAHPKEDPITGDLHFFGYGFFAPYLTYHRLSAAGELVESFEVQVDGPTMMHDFAITENYIVWLDLPVVFDLSLAGRGMPYRWDEEYGARIGLMRKGTQSVQWIDVDPCYVFHVGNAQEDASGNIVIDAVRYAPEVFGAIWHRIGGTTNPAAHTGGTVLYRWLLDPASGKASEQQLDDRSIEFPTINDRLTGLASNYLYAASGSSIVKYDMGSGASRTHEVGESRAAGEAEFVPAASGSSEDDGWLMSIVSEVDGSGSELVVLGARDLEFVASVRLPRGVPAGFHGCWLED